MSELYYTPPSDELFNEVKENAIALWRTIGDDKYGYQSQKIEMIQDIGNTKDNFMFMVAMFDIINQRKLSTMISEEACKEIADRMTDGGQPKQLNVFL